MIHRSRFNLGRSEHRPRHRGQADRIPDWKPVWRSLHELHAAVAPELVQLGPVRSPDESWAVRRALYAEWLAEPDAFVFVAEADFGLVDKDRVKATRSPAT